jgi:hypothetical protein
VISAAIWTSRSGVCEQAFRMQVKLGHAPDWRHAVRRAMFQFPLRIRGLGR